MTSRRHVLVLLLVLLRQPSPAVSQSLCASQAKTLPSNRTYSNCIDLPHLKATLHYTYDPSNSSLSVAYIASPAPSGAWIAWAINPTSTGMVGSQALVALKPTGGSPVVAKTFNISSYSSIVASPLSFAVWDLAADEVNGEMRLFGSVKLPVSATSLNQVWQVGGAVNGTQPLIHPLSAANKQSTGTLGLATSAAPAPSPGVTTSPAPAPSPGVTASPAPAPSLPSGTIATPPAAPEKNGGGRRMGGGGKGRWLGIAGVVVFGSLAF
ncbi:hypothetical protein MLD38_012418 [Melastoma candidum]|uniref:Uncharacterized protein n=1 Tax=Melastoma candidum TaxID=119954 RepID=A0ACB9R9C4_9MYRT|nr:hypothetical protein MLD38_012418 [Melastoma candidum]